MRAAVIGRTAPVTVLVATAALTVGTAAQAAPAFAAPTATSGGSASSPSPAPNPTPAAATTPGQSTVPTPPNVPADLAAAIASAQATRKPVEVGDRTTGVARTLANPDGTLTAQVSPVPARWKDSGGAWHNYDLTLNKQPDGTLTPAASDLATKLAATASAASTVALPQGASVTLAHPGASAAAPAVTGTTATYPGALPGGVDLIEQPLVDGLEETAVLHSAATPASYTDSFALPAGDTAKANSTGGIDIVTNAGAVVATFGGAVAHDNLYPQAGEGVQTPVTLTVVSTAPGAATISVGIDPAWLADPARVFPVTIDPTVYANTSGTGSADTYVSSEYTGNHSTESELHVGTYNSGADANRSYLQFNLGSGFLGSNAQVTAATFSAFNIESYACTLSGSNAVGAGGTNGSVNISALTWGNQPNPGTDSSGYVDTQNSAPGGGSTCPTANGTWVTWNIASLAQRWANGTTPNNGIFMGGDEQNNAGWHRYDSGETGSGSAPAISITYDAPGCNTYTGGGGGTRTLCGLVNSKYIALGGTSSGLLPTSDTGNTTTAEAGTYAFFSDNNSSTADAAILSVTASNTAYLVHGVIYSEWNRLGRDPGPLGFPVSDEYAASTPFNGTGDRQSDFEHGSIYWNHVNSAVNDQVEPSTLVGDQSYFNYDTLKLTGRLTAKVNRGTGNLELAAAGLTVPAVGSDRKVGFVYNSLDHAPGATHDGSGLLGKGWRLSDGFDTRLRINETDPTTGTAYMAYVDASGTEQRFSISGTTYTKPAGFDADLAQATCPSDDGQPSLNGPCYKLTMHSSQQISWFDANGNPVEQTDRNGNEIRFPNPASGINIAAITGNRLGYNGTAVTGADGATVHFYYNGPSGKLSSMCQSTTASNCSASATRSATTLVESLSYNSAGDINQITDPDGNVTQFTYNSSSSNAASQHDLTQITVQNPSGTTVQTDVIAYDSMHRAVTITLDTGETSGAGNALTTYDHLSANGTLLQFTPNQPRGNGGAGAKYTFDVAGSGAGFNTVTAGAYRLTSTFDQKGQQTSATGGYNSDNKPGTATNGAGNQTTFGYANNGESPNSQSDGTTSSSATYCANTGFAGANYLPSSGTDDSGTKTSYSYDGAGNMDQSQNGGDSAATAVTLYSSNPGDGSIKDTVDPVANHTTGANTTCGGPTSLGSTTAYTAFNVDGAANSSMPASSSGSGTVVPAASHELTSVDYSHLGAGLGTKSFTYDGFGRQVTATDGKGVVTTYTYDADGAQTNVAYSSAGSTPVHKTYDALGDVLTQTDAAGTTTNTYDGRGDLLTQSGPPGTMSYTYDGDGNLATSVDGNGTSRYHYDKADENDQVTEATGRIDIVKYNKDHKQTDLWENTSGTNGTAATYDSAGNTLQTPAGWSTHIANTLDNQNKLTQIKTTRASSDANGNRVSDLSYSYDLVGGTCGVAGTGTTHTSRRQKVTDNLTGIVTQYCYDPNERLTSATPTSGTAYTYSYDENGNILSRASTGATTTYNAYNAANQTCAQASTAPSGCGTGFSYDADGSLTASPTQSTFGYTPAEQTSGVTPAGGSGSSYTYAGTSQNELVSSGGASTATFTQGIPGITQMATASNGTLYFERTPGGQLLSAQSGTGSSVANYDYVPDGLGSIVAMVPANTTSTTTAGGTAVAAYSYTPYGAVATITDPAGGDLTVANANPFRFTGAYQDANTKLLHLGARWYDPNTGRFTQPDPSGGSGNAYAYAGDDPIDFTDPSGDVKIPLFKIYLGPDLLDILRYDDPEAVETIDWWNMIVGSVPGGFTSALKSLGNNIADTIDSIDPEQGTGIYIQVGVQFDWTHFGTGYYQWYFR
jgi:RHS repeat-associated protein